MLRQRAKEIQTDDQCTAYQSIKPKNVDDAEESDDSACSMAGTQVGHHDPDRAFEEVEVRTPAVRDIDGIRDWYLSGFGSDRFEQAAHACSRFPASREWENKVEHHRCEICFAAEEGSDEDCKIINEVNNDQK